MATMVLQMGTSSVLSTPPPTPPMEGPSGGYSPHTHNIKEAMASNSSSLSNTKENSKCSTTPSFLQQKNTTGENRKIPNSSAVEVSSEVTETSSREGVHPDVCERSTNPGSTVDYLTKASPGQTNSNQNSTNPKTFEASSTGCFQSSLIPTTHISSTSAFSPLPNGTTTNTVPRKTRPSRSRDRGRANGCGASLGNRSEVSKVLLNPEDYFRGVSPICRRLLEDMAAVRDSWGTDWANLTYDQQCRILDQAIVDEATVRRYEDAGMCPGPDCEYFPKLQLRTGQNFVRDEKLSERGFTCSWRDEHSAPFSWHTRSQMDLTLDTPPETPMEPPSLPHDVQLSNHNNNNSGNNSCKNNNNNNVATSAAASSTPTGIILRTAETYKGSSGLNGVTVTPADVSGTFTSRPRKKSNRSRRTPSAFSWHYEPNTKASKSNSQDIPDIVLDSSVSAKKFNAGKLKGNDGLSTSAHLVIRAGDTESNYGFLEKLRGAFCKLTTSCLPVHVQHNSPLSHSVHAPSSSPPDFRPPHVLAQANAVSRGVNVSTPITLPIKSTALPSVSTSTQWHNGNSTMEAAESFSAADVGASSVPKTRGPAPPAPNSQLHHHHHQLENDQHCNDNAVVNNNSSIHLTRGHNMRSSKAVVEISPTHSVTNITDNPLESTTITSSINTAINNNKLSTNISFTTRSVPKRRAPDPSKKPAAPHPPSDHVPLVLSTFSPVNSLHNTSSGVKDEPVTKAPSAASSIFTVDKKDDRDSDFMKEDVPVVDLSTSGENFIPKTGFDFLDNW